MCPEDKTDEDRLTLYHFTRPANVNNIMKAGIILGDVPTSPLDGFQAPWLTSDPAPVNQAWTVGTDKQDVRMTVEIRKTDKLRKWSSYAKSIGIDERWYDILDFTGGRGSESWYIYLGRIPPSWIVNVEYLRKETDGYEEGGRN